MPFLRHFCSFFQNKNNLPHPPSDNEPIDRVIFFSKFIKKNNKASPNAFMPHNSKSKAKMIALEMAESAKLILRE